MLAAGLTALAAPHLARAKERTLSRDPILLRTIPSTGEQVPAIGLGSWQTFDVADIAPITGVLKRFLELGGRVVDSSPMYGKSEEAIGKMLAAIALPNERPFLATKVWTEGKDVGITQMKRSITRLGSPATCPIPATSKVKHIEDNLGAMRGPIPDAAQRKAILAAV